MITLNLCVSSVVSPHSFCRSSYLRSLSRCLTVHVSGVAGRQGVAQVRGSVCGAPHQERQVIGRARAVCEARRTRRSTGTYVTITLDAVIIIGD